MLGMGEEWRTGKGVWGCRARKGRQKGCQDRGGGLGSGAERVWVTVRGRGGDWGKRKLY